MPPIVRGVYTTVHSFWGERWERLLTMVEDTEINALVIDVKDEAGTLLWPIDHPIARDGGGADWNPDLPPPTAKLADLHDLGGWAIARISCFKDTRAAKARPEMAVQTAGGGTWIARKDFRWLNPYQDAAGDWCIDVAVAAIEAGFDEVQFDYIRFPNGGDGDISGIRLPGVPDDRPREMWRHTDEIVEFLARASVAVHEVGGFVSADIFGLTTYDFSWDAGGTGQVIERIAEHVDVISPMVYPSHYGRGNYGLDPHPVDHAYETIWNSMQEAQMRTQGLHAKIRPWLEDFSPTWMGRSNSPARVKEQIQATYDNGIDGWMLWNAGNSFSVSALEPGAALTHALPDFVAPLRTANPDKPPDDPNEERDWPGMPECDQFPGRLQIGDGNLAGTRPHEPAPAFVPPNPDGSCPNDGRLRPATPEEAADDVAPSPTPSESEAAG